MNKSSFFGFLVSILGIIGLNTANAQISSGGAPFSFTTLRLPSQDYINVITLPYIDNDAEQQNLRLISNTKSNCANCEDRYYGKGLNISIDIKSQGTLDILEDSGKIWRLKIASATAYGMQFYFDKFNLPDEAILFIYNEERNMILGGYTSRNNPEDPNQPIKFGTQYIRGNNIFIEYYEPSGVEFEGEITITTLIHVFKDIFTSGPFGSSLPCHINVTCSEGEGWEKEIKSVALILTYNSDNQYAAHCSGALVNNTSQNGRPLFLTAKHCADGDFDLNPEFDYRTWFFLFNYQSTSCNSNGAEVPYSIVDNAILGANFVLGDGAGSPTSDYLLLELKTTTDWLDSHGVCYAGWTLTSSPEGPYTGIHHPAGDVKKKYL